jgi:hypothetical protein
MKLSEARIQAIVNDAMERLDDAGVVRFKGRVSRIRTELERAVLGVLKLDDQVTQEARDFISRMKNPPPEGSPTYEAMMLKQREELARRKGLA